MRVFLGSHRARGARCHIKQARFLIDASATFKHIDLSVRFVFDDLHDKSHRIDVLRFGPSAQFIARFAHRDIDVGAHRTFFHIAVA